jgi:hypothetical protein
MPEVDGSHRVTPQRAKKKEKKNAAQEISVRGGCARHGSFIGGLWRR